MSYNRELCCWTAVPAYTHVHGDARERARAGGRAGRRFYILGHLRSTSTEVQLYGSVHALAYRIPTGMHCTCIECSAIARELVELAIY